MLAENDKLKKCAEEERFRMWKRQVENQMNEFPLGTT